MHGLWRRAPASERVEGEVQDDGEHDADEDRRSERHVDPGNVPDEPEDEEQTGDDREREEQAVSTRGRIEITHPPCHRPAARDLRPARRSPRGPPTQPHLPATPASPHAGPAAAPTPRP